MIFDWYQIINRAEFEASGLVSKEVEAIFEGIGQKTVLVTRGNYVSIVIDGVMLSVGMAGQNPFLFGGHAVYLDQNDDIWLGVATTS